MKKIILLVCFFTSSAVAGAPDTNCPSGYVAINDPQTTIAMSCPSGTVSVGTANSCLATNPTADCIMYAPAGVKYSDDLGEYEFDEACPKS